uniref:Battenin n=1 Tax=Meloidogyne floridensis TaxID=298350 RepID=A0A915PDR5_9BILA
MFYIGINDIFCLFICGLLTGILALNGAVFCSFPNTIYIAGMVACVFWYNETLSAILLALNRCVEISMPSIGERLFRGYKTWLWMLLPLFYGILFGPTFKPRDVLKMLCVSRLNRIAATTMQINIGGTTQHTAHKNPTETRNQSRLITRHEEVF